MQRSIADWRNIFRNLSEVGGWVEIIWLDDSDEWALCHDCELFEDGFSTEREAEERLEYLEERMR